MKYFVILLTFTLQDTLLGQEQSDQAYRYEVQFGTDNDFLVFHTSTDQYYTYGVNLAFRWRPRYMNFIKNLFPSRTSYFQSIGANIEAYTPAYRLQETEQETQRPYAGWSYLSMKGTYGFLRSYLTWGIDIGILGPASQAGQFQNWFHKNITGDTVLNGWANQIPNKIGINMTVTYAHQLWKAHWIDCYTSATFSLGNVFIYFQPSAHLRIEVV